MIVTPGSPADVPSTDGITWHQLDDAGLISRETTYWSDTPVRQLLGIPAGHPPLLEEGFDPAALAGT